MSDLQARAAKVAEISEPVAIVDANDEGFYADILPDRSVRIGQLLYAMPPNLIAVATLVSDWLDALVASDSRADARISTALAETLAEKLRTSLKDGTRK